MAAAAAPVARKGETYRENSKKKDVRIMNIEAAKAVADAVRTSLGPRGMDKMVAQADGEVIITNDGATILNKMKVEQPAAKMLVDLAKSQDVVAGDGTTSVTVMCGALLRKSLELLERGVHPTVISDAFGRAADKAVEVLTDSAIPVSIEDREALIRAANTSLSSKIISQNSALLSPMAVDCLMKILDPARPDLLDLKDVKVVVKSGATIDDSEMIDGLVLDLKAAKGANGPTRMENAKVALIQFQVSPPKTDIENNVIISDYAQMDRILKEERNYILQMVKKIKASGANVLLIQKSILRDAVTELSLHYLAKAKIMVVKDVEREDIEFISKTLGCLPIAHVDHMRPEKLGHAAMVEEADLGKGGKVIKVTGIENQGRTATVLLRGSNKLALGEADRSLHDALCVVRCLVQKRYLIAGGGSPEMELSYQLSKWAKTLVGMESYCVRAFAEALEIIPYTLAENAGLNPIEIVTQLRLHHASGQRHHGINVRKGATTDMMEENVVQPLLVTTSALALATEAARLILKIDDIVPTR
ncbi:T-complex 1 subunit delta [Micractinium conductrix]|uniref:T-complex protein 1 subunit delta n=1 Tax=Micractinium conductrix TaxID=554055 RepID=A0A2P6V4Q6_9CHLO|nr:T-complex 1 subunit delta [Micractinium conductrix]|eukprot:PSC69071.1 T-complex 1 subunit delta [Micractinium conductrix]